MRLSDIAGAAAAKLGMLHLAFIERDTDRSSVIVASGVAWHRSNRAKGGLIRRICRHDQFSRPFCLV